MNNTDTPLPSKRPYMLRAIWQWCVDAGLTPQILVNATLDGVDVPAEYVKDGAIVLNVHDRAVRDLDMGNDSISFSARFAGRPRGIFVPVDAVLAIYARENGQGLFFEVPSEGESVSEGAVAPADEAPRTEAEDEPSTRRGRPDLRIV